MVMWGTVLNSHSANNEEGKVGRGRRNIAEDVHNPDNYLSVHNYSIK